MNLHFQEKEKPVVNGQANGHANGVAKCPFAVGGDKKTD